MSFGASWGGIPCSLDPRSPPRYVRARGLEPSVSSVSFPASVFLEGLLPKFDAGRFGPREPDNVSGLLAALNATKPQSYAGAARTPYVGDLVFQQAAPGAVAKGAARAATREARARSLFYVEARAIDPESSDPLVEITLADIRRWWDDFGEISRSWNLERAGGFVAHTAKDRGRKPTPLVEIVQALLVALPGSLPVSLWPEEAEGLVADVRAWGGNPKEALDAILAAYRLELDIGPNLAARFYLAGTGAIGELGAGSLADNDVPHDPLTGVGAWSGRVTAAGNAYYQRPAHENPTEVVVIGGRRLIDCQVDFMTPVLPYDAADASGVPVQHVIEATPRNLTDYVRDKLPGLAAPLNGSELGSSVLGGTARNLPAAPRVSVLDGGSVLDTLGDLDTTGPSILDTLGPVSAQARLDAARGDVPPADASTPGPPSRAVAAVLAGTILDTLDGFRSPPKVEPETPSILDSLPENQPKKPRSLVGDKLGEFLIGEGGALTKDIAPDGDGNGSILVTHLWQRLPGLDSQEWPLEVREIPEEKRRTLKKLWYVYQVPDPLRRLLRIRKRAEVNAKGKRLGPVCEAFGFRKVRTKISNPKLAEAAIADAKEAAAFAALAREYESLAGEVTRLKAEIDKIRLPTLAEIEDLFARDKSAGEVARALYEKLLDPFRVYHTTEPLLPATTDAAQEATIDRFRRLSADFLNELGIGSGGGVALNFFGVAGGEGALDAAGFAAREARLNEEIAKLEAKMLAVERLLNPLSAAWKDMGALQGEASQQRSDAGHVSAETQAKIEAKQKEIDELDAKRLAAPVFIPPEIEVTRLKNLGRRQVEFRILDAELGLIELAELPCWVADENVSSLDQTWVIPMPVRLTFGTVNSLDVEDRSVDEGPVPGYYMGVLARAVRNSPQLRSTIGATGSRIPKAPGESQLRFTFSRADLETGAAEVSPYPYRVTIDAPDFRELVRLDGSSNRAKLLEQAKAIASALLKRPDVVDAGHLDVLEPREVALNGRITATSITLAPERAGFLTVVSFDSEPAPLGDLVEGLKRARKTLSFTFGIDVEADLD
jgi:hypothetical protein